MHCIRCCGILETSCKVLLCSEISFSYCLAAGAFDTIWTYFCNKYFIIQHARTTTRKGGRICDRPYVTKTSPRRA